MNKQEEYKFLQDLKKQIESLNFYLGNIKVRKEDRNNSTNLDRANRTISDLRYKLDHGMLTAKTEADKEKMENIDSKYSQSLKEINKPDAEMLKNAEANLNVRRAFPGRGINLIREAMKNVIKRAAEEGAAMKKAAEENGPTTQYRRGSQEEDKTRG